MHSSADVCGKRKGYCQAKIVADGKTLRLGEETAPPPDQHLFDWPEEMSVYLKGYLATQDCEE